MFKMFTLLAILSIYFTSCGSQNIGNKQAETALHKGGIKVVPCPELSTLGYKEDDPIPVSIVCGDFSDGPEALSSRLNSISEDYYYPTSYFRLNNYPIVTNWYTQSWRANRGEGDRMTLGYNPATDLILITSAETK